MNINFFKFIIILLAGTGLFIIYKVDILNFINFNQNQFQLTKNHQNQAQIQNSKLSSSALILNNYLLSAEKPSKIEIIGLSKKFQNTIDEIKKIKISQDRKSKIYYSIQLFTNESDPDSNLIAQIKTIETSTGNTLKEESIDLK